MGLLVVTAATPGQDRTSRVIFIRDLGFALFLLVAGAENGPAGLWQWKMLFIYSQGFWWACLCAISLHAQRALCPKERYDPRIRPSCYCFLMQVTMLQQTDSTEPRFSEPVRKKPRTEQTESSDPDFNETKRFRASYSSRPFKFSEELEKPCDASTQVWKSLF